MTSDPHALSAMDLPMLPEGWQWKSLSELIMAGKNICYGIVQPGKHDDTGVPMVNTGDIQDGYVSPNVEFKVSKALTEKYKRSVLQGDEVLVTLVGANFGRVAVAPRSYAGFNCSRAVGVIPVIGEEKYIMYALRTPLVRSYMNNWANTTAQPTFNLGDVARLPVAWAPSFDRQKISYFLDSIEMKIQLNHQTNQTLEQMAQAIFKSWFVDFEPVKAKMAALEAGGSEDDALLAAMQAIAGSALFASNAADADAATQLARLQAEHPEQYATLRATAELFPAAMQDSELGEIPEGWSVNKIEDLIQRISVGKRYSQKTVFESGSIPVLDQGKSGIIGYHNDEPGLKASEDDPVIVFANHTCYMRLVMHDFSAIQNVLPFKGKELNIYWIYLATLGKQKFTEYKGHWPDFVIKEVVTPNDIIASHFGSIVKNLFITQFHNEQQSASLSNIRDTLLPKLLSGELSVSAAADQITKAEEAVNVQS